MIKIVLTEPVKPKARPRVLKNKGVLPKTYREWKTRAKKEIEEQFEENEEKPTTLNKCLIKIDLIGNHPKKGDIDNIAGAILDILVDAQIIKNDNLNNIPSLEINFQENKEQPPIVEIYLTEI